MTVTMNRIGNPETVQTHQERLKAFKTSSAVELVAEEARRHPGFLYRRTIAIA